MTDTPDDESQALSSAMPGVSAEWAAGDEVLGQVPDAMSAERM
jgi:hypothetical protein